MQAQQNHVPLGGRLARALETPARRMACVGTIMALVWGAMIVCQGMRTPCHSADWDLMSEVGRRLALGDTLYVDAMDQKGPLCYATYALEWLVARTQINAYLLSNIAVWLLLVASSLIAARIVEESRKPWLHLIAQALLAGVIIVPHVGCVEEWLVPFGLLGALWVRRLARGVPVAAGCWVVLGLSAAFALWAKFTTSAQFVFLLCYAASQDQTSAPKHQGLGRAAAIALITCALASAAVLVWLWRVGSLAGMFEHYLHAASDGYAERMSIVKHISSGNPSTTHMSSFFVGLPLALWSIFMIARAARRRWLVIAGGAIYIVCCFATFVGYYRFQLAPLVVLGACELTGQPCRLAPLRWIDAHIGIKQIAWLASIAAIAAATAYTCNGTPGVWQKSARMKETLHKTVGDSSSVLVWQFDHTWVYGELGNDFYYPMPARYNASQDLWDATAGADLAAGRWQYLVVSITEGNMEVGDNAIVNDNVYPVLATAGNMAVLDACPGSDVLSCPPYRLP
ncbi:MAG: hypothetical protein IKG21_06930 [Atopobiaceae bacterium]|nr:hypothetical protein [Atopobiaceae bacterium]